MNPATERRLGLFGRVLTLVAISVLAVQAISVLLIFALPPPIPDFYRMSEVVMTYRGITPNFTDRRPLVVELGRSPPGPTQSWRPMSAVRGELAQAFGVAADHVVIAGDPYPFSDRRVIRILRDRMAREGHDREEHFLLAPFSVGVHQANGQWKIVRPEGRVGLEPWQKRMILWFVLSSVAMAPVAYLFTQRLVRPFSLFAQAAEKLGRDPRGEPIALALRGPPEIAVAITAFNDMQDRLRRYVDDRTAMVGAMAHDLRTPLTRLKFRIESAAPEARDKMAADINQMEEMIAAALTFVRDAGGPAERAPMELSSLLESLCDEMAETGAQTEVVAAEKVVVHADPMALRRMFSNLLENAIKFGQRARVRVRTDGASAVVEVEDDGPGIPPGDLDRVFEPFYRREPSRSRETGGFGLGLAVVRSVAIGHGGTVTLANRNGGGMTASVRLPI